MRENSAKSVLLLRVKPGSVNEAIQELKSHPEVSYAEPVLGTYDILATGNFPDMQSLQNFATAIQQDGFCEAFYVSPAVEHWERNGATTQEYSAWTLINTSTPTQTWKDLQQFPNVSSAYITLGSSNVVAHITASKPQEINKTILTSIQKIRGIRRTETFVEAKP